MAEEDRLDVLSAGAESAFFEPAWEQPPDVALAVALSANQVPPFACPVVLLSNNPEVGSVPGAQVHAWLPLTASLEEISAAVFAAACDLWVLTAGQIRQYGRPELDVEDRGIVEKLTARELQVLRLLADGLGNKQIAGQLGLSDHTAKFHVAQILAKLGATSRTEAVTIGIRRGLVPV